jgi:hypothetical protein
VTVAYHLCGYDKATGPLAEEQAVPEHLLPAVRTLVETVPDDRDLILPYELTTDAVLTLARPMGLGIDPAGYHYYFEASDTGVGSKVATSAS